MATTGAIPKQDGSTPRQLAGREGAKRSTPPLKLQSHSTLLFSTLWLLKSLPFSSNSSTNPTPLRLERGRAALCPLPYSHSGFCFWFFLFQQGIAETAEAAWTARAGLGETLLNTRRPATNYPSERVTLKVRTSSGTTCFGSTTHTQMPFHLRTLL